MAEIYSVAEANVPAKRRLRYAAYQIISVDKKEIEKISVSELTEKADLSRATFYNYYNSMEAFSEETLDYLCRVLINQLFKFFSEGRENLRKNCKEKNLLLLHEDRLLLSVIGGFVDFSLVEKGLGIVWSTFEKELIYTVFDKEAAAKYMNEIRFFATAYVLSISESFIEGADSERLEREINYMFDLWNILFPDDKR